VSEEDSVDLLRRNAKLRKTCARLPQGRSLGIPGASVDKVEARRVTQEKGVHVDTQAPLSPFV
jgi:hypothetical protein